MKMKDAKRPLDPAEISWIIEQRIRDVKPEESPEKKLQSGQPKEAE